MSIEEKETLFGYEIPMPRSDLFIALATVVGFLPFTVVVYHIIMWTRSLVNPKAKLA